MSRRVKKPLRPRGERPRGARPYRDKQRDDYQQAHRPGGKPARFVTPRATKPAPFVAEPGKIVAEAPPLPTKVQTVVVTADEDNMRVDRFLEARFPGLSSPHPAHRPQRRTARERQARRQQGPAAAGQNIRIPPLRLDTPKVAGSLSEAAAKTLTELKAMTLYEDDDVLVLNKRRDLRCRAAPAPRAMSTRCSK